MAKNITSSACPILLVGLDGINRVTKLGFSMKAEVIEPNTLFFNDLSFVGITRTKLPAQIYVDDRAYQYTGQTVKEFLLDFTEI